MRCSATRRSTRLTPNVLALQIQPDEGVSLQFGAKQPGPEIELGGVRMNFRYSDYFNTAPATGYETLVYDCMIGDAMLFQRADSVEAGWAVVQPILDLWQNDKNVAARILPRRQRRPGSRRPAAVAQRPALAADRAEPAGRGMARPIIVAPSILSADFGAARRRGARGRRGRRRLDPCRCDGRALRART